jgi:hypothetical protein
MCGRRLPEIVDEGGEELQTEVGVPAITRTGEFPNIRHKDYRLSQIPL